MSGDTAERHILVFIGPYPDDAIGENFIKLPFLRALKHAFPGAKITWIHGHEAAMFAGILEPLARGLIAEFLPDTVLGHGWASALSPRRLLPDRHFDVIIDTQKNPLYTLMLRRISHTVLISPSWRYFFSSRRPNKKSINNQPKPRSLAEKLLALLALATGETAKPNHLAVLPDEYLTAVDSILPRTSKHKPIYIGLAPGAGRMDTGKCWPLENYLTVANEQLDCGRTPVFFLGPLEQEWRSQIETAVPDALFAPLEWHEDSGPILNGPTLTVALASHLSISVANCSGTGHMLAAGGSKIVSLFGPTDPGKFAPYTPDLLAIRAQGFGKDTIDAIPVQAVLDAIDSGLGSAPDHTD